MREFVPGRIVFTTSFGIEDQWITHVIFTRGLDIEVATLDTGRLFPQTYELWERTEARYARRIAAVYPRAEPLQDWVREHGVNGFYKSVENRKACCHLRKVEPLARLLAGASAWITGLRADQSAERGAFNIVEFDAGHKLLKVNPLIDYSREKIVAATEEFDVPVNELHAQGFLSIGCAPCTRAVQPGESERAGRWWWEEDAKKECGLHVGEDGVLRRGPAPVQRVGENWRGRMMSSLAIRKLGHLDRLEAESIHIMREVVAECERPVMLYSIGKDSARHAASGDEGVLSRASRRFPLLHVDTTWKFKRNDRLPRRDRAAARRRAARPYQSEDGVEARHQSRSASASALHTAGDEDRGAEARRSTMAASTRPSAARGATRKRAAPRSASSRIRSAQPRWDPQAISGPSSGGCTTRAYAPARAMRVFPLSNWTELDVWDYIARRRHSRRAALFRQGAPGRRARRRADHGRRRAPAAAARRDAAA